MGLAGKYLTLAPAAPWPGGAVFTAEGPEGKKVFLREASRTEAGAAPFLSHPNMPGYIETVPVSGGGTEKKFVVYEYFEGESLASIMARGGTFTEFEALKIGYEIAEVLKYLHGLSPRAAHGAVSPDAVFRAKGGRIYLCGCAAAGEPAADLKGLAGLLRVGVEVTPLFCGNQEAAMGHLLSGEVAAAGVNHQVMASFAQRRQIKYRVLAESEPYFDLAVMASPRVSQADGEKVRQAFVGMSREPEGQRVLLLAAQSLELPTARGFVAADDRDYRNYRSFFSQTRVPLNE